MIEKGGGVWDLVNNYNTPLLIIGDKRYISQSLSAQLKSEKDIRLIYMKCNSSFILDFSYNPSKLEAKSKIITMDNSDIRDIARVEVYLCI